MRLPNHIGIIPDGNRRWAVGQGLHKQDGYDRGISPGLELYRACRDLGIREMSFYGFTADNAKRPIAQRRAFTSAETPVPPVSRRSFCPTPRAMCSGTGA